MLQIIRDALSLLPPKMNTLKAIILLLAIAYQESEGKYRRQKGNGPARGLWQFEKGGGVHGVMTHPASHDLAMGLCAHFRIPFNETAVWSALETNDVFAAAIARLLLWTDADPIPGDQHGDWQYYESIWRPGKPRPREWPDNYQRALDDVA